MTTSLKTLKTSEIRRDGDLQARVGMNEEVVEDYANCYREGVTMQPPRCFFDGAVYWLGDGFHRVEAISCTGREALVCEVSHGTRRDAVLYAAGANKTHGLRRSNEDKRNAVSILLNDSEWATWSNRRIASHCGVSDMFVGNLRRELGAAEPASRTGSDGRTINTINIGRERPTANGSQSMPGSADSTSARDAAPVAARGARTKRTVPRKHQANDPAVDLTEALDEIHQSLEDLLARLPGNDPPAAKAALARLMRMLEGAFQDAFGQADE
jgi:hypothetical protein